MKKVISVSLNEDGTIKGLLFEGNKNPTPVKTVIRMLEDGKTSIDFADTGIQIVTKKDGTKYLRSTPNDTKDDNFGTMAAAVEAEETKKEKLWDEIKTAEEANPGLLAKLRNLLRF